MTEEEEKIKWKISHHIAVIETAASIASEIQIPIFEEYFQLFDLKIKHINNMILHIEKRFDQVDTKFIWVIGLIFTTFATTAGMIMGLYSMISKLH